MVTSGVARSPPLSLTWIAPIFIDLAPSTVTPEHVDAWYHAPKVMKSVAEAHRAMKIWRALWQVAAAMHYCSADQDPSFSIRRKTPKGRSATWEEGEVVRLVKEAWRQRYHGLACIIAIAYDAQFAGRCAVAEARGQPGRWSEALVPDRPG
jgi:hypothetical protein